MARMDFATYRQAIWQIVQGCCECGKDDCDEWCMELCEAQMDEVIERIAADVSKAVSGSSDD